VIRRPRGPDAGTGPADAGTAPAGGRQQGAGRREPDAEVARVERMVSTFVLGYAISETGGRFAAGDPQERRALLERIELPAHRKLADHLETTKSWDAEFEADLDDLVGPVENVASG